MHKLFSIKNQSRSAMAVSSTSDSAAPGYEIGYRTVSELAMIGPQTVCVSPISQCLSESTPFPPSLFLPHPRAHTHIASGRAGEGGEGGKGGKGGGGTEADGFRASSVRTWKEPSGPGSWAARESPQTLSFEAAQLAGVAVGTGQSEVVSRPRLAQCVTLSGRCRIVATSQ